jgi:hypothetical protein
MTSFAKPETVACTQCDWYFARRVLRSYRPFLRVVYSDGGTKHSIDEYIPNVGRCPSCNLLIDNINDLPVIPEPPEPSWLRKCWAKLTDEQINVEYEYEYLATPTYRDYAEMFASASALVAKRNYAVPACRAFHQTYFLAVNDEDEDCNNRSNAAVYEPSKASRVLYQDISDFVLGNPMRPVLDEYTLICADIYRLRGDFSSAMLEYQKVKDPELKYVVELGQKWCVEGNASLMELRL